MSCPKVSHQKSDCSPHVPANSAARETLRESAHMIQAEVPSFGRRRVSRKAAVLGRMVRSVAEADRPAVTDRELLRRYARDNDEAAFASLVTRHTAMVLGVCRRALPTVQDAEDACQATFLVLA